MVRLLILLPTNLFAPKIVDMCIAASDELHALGNSTRRSLWLWGRFRKYETIRFFAGDEVNPLAIERLKAMCASKAIDMVAPIDLDGAAFLAAARSHIPRIRCFPFSSPEVLRLLADKWSCGALAKEAHVEAPTSFLLRAAKDLEAQWVDDLAYPVVVKPARLEGGRGVVRIGTRKQLEAHVLGGRRYSRPPLIVQQFIHGRDADVDLLADNGKIVFQVCRERGADGTFRYFRDPDLERAAAALVARSGYTGIANLDFVREVGTGTYIFLEFNPRAWSNIWLSELAGMNFIRLGMELALGAKTPREFSQPPLKVFNIRGACRAFLQGRGFEVSEANRLAIGAQLRRPDFIVSNKIAARFKSVTDALTPVSPSKLFAMRASFNPPG
ncbi:MAG TPA: ATP-grasp domain-containing protein [Caulobacteraceae bacterium]